MTVRNFNLLKTTEKSFIFNYQDSDGCYNFELAIDPYEKTIAIDWIYEVPDNFDIVEAWVEENWELLIQKNDKEV